MGRSLVVKAVSRMVLQTSLNPTDDVSVHPCSTRGSPFLVHRVDGGRSMEFPIDKASVGFDKASDDLSECERCIPSPVPVILLLAFLYFASNFSPASDANVDIVLPEICRLWSGLGEDGSDGVSEGGLKSSLLCTSISMHRHPRIRT